MAVSSSTLSFLMVPRIHKPPTRHIAQSLSSRASCSSPIIFKGFRAPVKPVKLRESASFAASSVVGGTADTRSSDGGEASAVSDSVEEDSLQIQNHRSGGGGDEDDQKMTRVSDKLIGIFMVDKPTPTEWRRLLAFSKEWNNIRPHFYKRCQERADSEDDPGMKHKLLKLARRIKEVDEDVQRHDELLNVIKEKSEEMDELVARRRKDFTKEFFVHLQTVAESLYDNPTEQADLAKLGSACLASVLAYDEVQASQDAIGAAQMKLEDIVNSPSLDAACKKIDDLAQKNQLDSALVLMLTKAWSAAKDTNMVKDEVKDVLYHLYMTARGNLDREIPKDVRILKYLLTIEDADERLSALNDAFTPGEEIQGKDVDLLYTTPEKLHLWMKTIIDAYHLSGKGTLLREARDLMDPKRIQKIEELKRLVETKFM